MPDRQTSRIQTSPDCIQAKVAFLLTCRKGLDSEVASACFKDAKQLAQLENFRGFITKVMHNGIRKFIPTTLRLLSEFKIELAFFKTVSSSFQTLRANGPILADVHLKWFKEVLSDWVEQVDSDEARLVEDVFLHELVLHRARKVRAIAIKPETMGALWFDGEIVLQRYDYDVLAVLQGSRTKGFSASAMKYDEPAILAYWLDPSQKHNVTQLDRLTAHVLSMVNGCRNSEDIVRQFNQGGITEVNLELINHVIDNLIATTPLRRVGLEL